MNSRNNQVIVIPDWDQSSYHLRPLYRCSCSHWYLSVGSTALLLRDGSVDNVDVISFDTFSRYVQQAIPYQDRVYMCCGRGTFGFVSSRSPWPVSKSSLACSEGATRARTWVLGKQIIRIPSDNHYTIAPQLKLLCTTLTSLWLHGDTPDMNTLGPSLALAR